MSGKKGVSEEIQTLLDLGMPLIMAIISWWILMFPLRIRYLIAYFFQTNWGRVIGMVGLFIMALGIDSTIWQNSNIRKEWYDKKYKNSKI